jgi:predicted nucleic acid-binding protein
MIGLDASILVRYLTQDDPVQSPKANAFIERQLDEDARGFISVVALVDTVWGLGRHYGFSDLEIATSNRKRMSWSQLPLSKQAAASRTRPLEAWDLEQAVHTLTFDRKARGFQASNS